MPDEPDDRAVAQLLLAPFRVADARAAGLTRRELQSRRFQRLFHDVYAPANLPPTLPLRCDAARLVLPGAVFSHWTATGLYNVPCPPEGAPIRELPALGPCALAMPRIGEQSDAIDVTFSDPCRVHRRRGLRLHAWRLPAEHVREWQGRPVTSPARTWLDLAAHLAVVDLVVLGDALLRRGLATIDDLAAVVDWGGRRRGVCAAREALALVREGSDSPPETKVRLVLVGAGYEEPDLNTPLYDEWGQWLATPDLRLRGRRVSIEYDGETHYTDPRQRRQDVLRNQLIQEYGDELVVLNAVHLRQPTRILDAVAAAVRRSEQRQRGAAAPWPRRAG